ncbi:MAG: YHYH protein, partial [Myxococcales bacterium]|nr:YHYH protein [Myxococcales bacterium]
SPFYGPNEGPTPDPYGDPVYNGIMDDCLGHTAQAGDYHFHAFLDECLGGAGDLDTPSPILGYALDGFPIYGPYGCVDAACTQVVEFQSSWEQTGDPTTYAWDNHAYVAKAGTQYLDQCNGRTGPDGKYRYHATAGFPYLLGCYRGTPSTTTGGGGETSCTTAADCTGKCAAGALGCTCFTKMDGAKVCRPTCTTAADCPAETPTNVCHPQQKVCVPPPK